MAAPITVYHHLQEDKNSDKGGQHWIPIRASEGVGMQEINTLPGNVTKFEG
jgi:hypothetical protein